MKDVTASIKALDHYLELKPQDSNALKLKSKLKGAQSHTLHD
jgi:hypothetical protein